MPSQTGSLEARLFRHYWDDGLLDLFAGLGILAIGLSWMFDLVPLGAITPAVLLPLWNPLRQRLVEPRAGLVEFSERRDQRNRRLLLASAWLGLGTLALGVGVYFWVAPRAGGILPGVIAGLPAALLGLLSFATGLGLGLPRFLAYGALLVLCGVGVVATGAEPEAGMLAGAAVILGCGGVLLARFLSLDVLDEE